MASFPKSVHLMEVGPRDGLQIEAKIVSTEDKVRLVNTIADAGIDTWADETEAVINKGVRWVKRL